MGVEDPNIHSIENQPKKTEAKKLPIDEKLIDKLVEYRTPERMVKEIYELDGKTEGKIINAAYDLDLALDRLDVLGEKDKPIRYDKVRGHMWHLLEYLRKLRKDRQLHVEVYGQPLKRRGGFSIYDDQKLQEVEAELAQVIKMGRDLDDESSWEYEHYLSFAMGWPVDMPGIRKAKQVDEIREFIRRAREVAKMDVRSADGVVAAESYVENAA